MTPSGRVVPRRLLAQELRRLRDESGKTLEEVASFLMISTSKLSRLEKGDGRPQQRDVRDLINFYGIEGTTLADRLRTWTAASQQQPWWTGYSRKVDIPTLGEHVDYEAEASIARIYTVTAVPVLLQTREYAQAYYRSTESWRSVEQIDALVDFRMDRQVALNRQDGRPSLELVAVAHEAGLRQLVGSAEIMRDQLDALIERSTAPNIELRIFPFEAPPLFSFSCRYAHFEFASDTDNEIVHIEHHGFDKAGSAEMARQYKGHHEALRRHSLSPQESRALIEKVKKQHFS